MSNNSNNNRAAQLRRAWIERQLAAAGKLNIAATAHTLGVSRAQISADLAALMAINKAIRYDTREKCYLWTEGASVRTKLPEYIATVAVTKANGELHLTD